MMMLNASVYGPLSYCTSRNVLPESPKEQVECLHSMPAYEREFEKGGEPADYLAQASKAQEKR